MCYNSCEHFRFNPVSGEGNCRNRSSICPDELEKCAWCDTDTIRDDAEEYNERYFCCTECLAEYKADDEDE